MPSVGKVYLVGAGPGDPGLLTMRGCKCLAAADVVLYDGLVNPELLRLTNANCQRTSRTIEPGGRSLHQDEINASLIEAAAAGKTVVRLKGGDPFVFGRGAEEAAALADAGIPTKSYRESPRPPRPASMPGSRIHIGSGPPLLRSLPDTKTPPNRNLCWTMQLSHDSRERWSSIWDCTASNRSRMH